MWQTNEVTVALLHLEDDLFPVLRLKKSMEEVKREKTEMRGVNFFEALPWKRAIQEIHQHKAQALEIISTTLPNTKMSVHRGKAVGANKTIVLKEMIDNETGEAEGCR
jgi:hypothetical protein